MIQFVVLKHLSMRQTYKEYSHKYIHNKNSIELTPGIYVLVAC